MLRKPLGAILLKETIGQNIIVSNVICQRVNNKIYY